MTNFLNILLVIIILIGLIYYINKSRLIKTSLVTIQNTDKLKNLSNYQLVSILNNLNPSQLQSLNKIKITNNIINIINNDDITKIDFKKYYPDELLFLTEKQVQNISTTQLLNICSINIHSYTNNITAITAIYNKLSFIQIQNIATSEKYNSLPYNRLSLETFSLLLKSIPNTNVKKIINSPMFFTTLPVEHINVVKTYLTPEQNKRIDDTIVDIINQVQIIIDSVPKLPTPLKLENGEYDTNIETNDQLIVYTPIILVLASPLLTSKINKNKNPVQILKSLPKIIVDYLIPTTITSLYFTDPFLVKLFNDAELIDNISGIIPENKHSIEEKPILKEEVIYVNEVKTYTIPEILKLSKHQLLDMNKIQLSTIILHLSPQQILLLNITPITTNIDNFIKNKNITNFDFSNYKSIELLYLSISQVQQLSNLQLNSILKKSYKNLDLENMPKDVNRKEKINEILESSSADIIMIIYKLNLTQIKYLATSSNYLFPLNRLSINQLLALPKTYFSNMSEILPPVILSLSTEKFDAIKNNFSNKQMENYNNQINEIMKIFIKFIDNINDTDSSFIFVTLILSSQQIGQHLLKMNIDPINILRKLSPKLKEKLIISNVEVEQLMHMDPYTLSLYNNAGFIAPF